MCRAFSFSLDVHRWCSRMGHYAGLSGINLAWKLIAHCSTWALGMLLSAITAYSEQVTDYFNDNYTVWNRLLCSLISEQQPQIEKLMLQQSDHIDTRKNLYGIERSWYKSARQTLNIVYQRAAALQHFMQFTVQPVRAFETLFGSAVLRWGVWYGNTLSLLTAHLSHFVSDYIHLHGTISSCVAGCWHYSVHVFVLKPHKYTNIKFLPNRKVEYWKSDIFYCLYSPFIGANVFFAFPHQLYIRDAQIHAEPGSLCRSAQTL